MRLTLRIPALPSILLAALVAANLCACGSTPAASKQIYDLGPVLNVPTIAVPTNFRIAIADISAPATLDSDAMWYRLLYDNPQQARPYAQHRWNMSPAALLVQNLGLNFASLGAQILHSNEADQTTPLLKIELLEFAQLFQNPSVSNAQISLRASLFVRHQLVAQRYFSQSAAADSPDAAAGARAMAQASNALSAAMFKWTKQQLPSP